jgi:2-keto-3-deoxy-L-rhamnonate aldolase RhmA
MEMVKEKLRTNQLTVGSWLTLANESIAEIMCEAGFEWLAIDLEHSSTTLAQAENLIRIIDAKGVCPLVRLSSADEVQVKRVMDSGAHGVIVPQVSCRKDADKVHRAMHYPPHGERGVGLGRAQGYGAGFDAYRQWLSESAILVAQIEHIDALGHLEPILTHPGVDAVMVGPYDLSASMGVPGDFNAPEYVDAMSCVLRVARAHNKPAGIHVVEPSTTELQQRIEQGYSFIAYSVDFRMIDVACREGLGAIKP